MNELLRLVPSSSRLKLNKLKSSLNNSCSPRFPRPGTSTVGVRPSASSGTRRPRGGLSRKEDKTDSSAGQWVGARGTAEGDEPGKSKKGRLAGQGARRAAAWTGAVGSVKEGFERWALKVFSHLLGK